MKETEERLIRIEERLEERSGALEKRFDDLKDSFNTRIDDMWRSLRNWIIAMGIVVGIISTMINALITLLK